MSHTDMTREQLLARLRELERADRGRFLVFSAKTRNRPLIEVPLISMEPPYCIAV